MTEILIERLSASAADQQPFEIVERKGLGHPDTICDLLMEAASLSLCREYIQTAGRILHHNLDKGLLVAGQSIPRPGGGTVVEPMKIILGDRATRKWQGVSLPIDEIVEQTAREWFLKNLRFVDPSKHVIFQNEIRPGSTELLDIFARPKLTANDTSVGVGYAPLSETEKLVLEAEHYLNSADLKSRFPEAGEDVKVMGVRRGRKLQMTVAVAFVDRFIATPSLYFERKVALRHELQTFLQSRLRGLDDVSVELNTLDDPERGAGGVYLTVLGTSAEGADGGEVGRGNRVNGLISFHRHVSLEAAAGKNPVSHVGKIYNLFSQELARTICEKVAGLEEVTVWMCSQIGQPLDQPWWVSLGVIPKAGVHIAEVSDPIRHLVSTELAGIESFTQRLIRGDFPVA